MDDLEVKEEVARLSKKFLTAEKFYNEVEFLVRTKEMGYAEAVISVCEARDIDYEDLHKKKGLISELLIKHLKEEGEANGLLKPDSSLPI